MNKSRIKWFLVSCFAFSIQLGFAQGKTLTGVVNEGGKPLPGVSITIQGTDKGTQTDLDGKYVIDVRTGDKLVFSFIGMQNITYTVGKDGVCDLTMCAYAEELEGLVVLAHGQEKTRNEITGNVVSIKGDVIANTPVVSVDQALQGRVAGLQISSTSGSPGAMQNIRIRGTNSISASNEPLYVVDGIPMNNTNVSGNVGQADEAYGTTLSALSAINSDDIASISVLKDAAATSAYGARGANGVILITTKKGAEGKPSFNFKSSLGFQNPSRKGPKYLSGEQKKELWLEAVYNTYGEMEGFSKEQTWDWYYDPANEMTAFPNQDLYNWVKSGSKVHDWKKAVDVKNAEMSILNFSVSGGDEKGTYFGSLVHEKYKGTMIGTDFRKINGNFNFTRKFSDKVEIKIGAMVSNILQNGVLEGYPFAANPSMTRMLMSPWTAIYNEDGSYNLDTGGMMSNVLYILDQDKYRNDITRVISSNSLRYDIAENLKYETALSLDYTQINYEQYNNPKHGDGLGIGGSAKETNRRIFNYVWQNALDYRLYLGESHQIDMKALMEFQKNKQHFLEGEGEVMAPGLQSVGTASANFKASTEYEDWSQLSYLGMLNYKYDNRYILDLTFRREGSSRFTKQHRWGAFYAVGAAWNISSEEFLIDSETISLLRARGTYGTTGNSSIASNLYRQTLAVSPYNGKAGLYGNQIGASVGWEKQEKLDFGVEFGFFQSRLSGGFAYYLSKSKDLLYTLPLSQTTGFMSQMVNLGNLQNQGFEVELAVDIIRKENLSWSVGGNIGTVKSKVTSLPVVNGKKLEVIGTNVIQEGRILSEWYLPEYAGVNPDNGEAQWYAKDGSKTSNYNEAEHRYLGCNSLPKVSGGINTHVNYKGLYLDALFSFATGYKIYDSWSLYTNSPNTMSLELYNGSEELLNRWQKPGDITDVPVLTTFGGMEYTQASTRFLYDGDHIRLRQLTIGYYLPKAFIKPMKLDELNLSVTAINPFIWVKDSRLKVDPEVGALGFIDLTTPITKSVVFSLNIKF